MKRSRICTLVLLAVIALPAYCGPIADLFKKSPKPKPEERVPQLLITLKTDLDEHKRSAAAEELRQYDPNAFADIIPMLIDAARNDRAAGVRVEAVQSLAKFRPITSEIGQILEQAEKDPSMRVKIQARTSLVQYHLAGYHAGKKTDGPLMQTNEPPQSVNRPPSQYPTGTPGEVERVVPAGSYIPPPERPLAIPQLDPPTVPAPMPSAPPPSPPPEQPEPLHLDLPK
jgi:hypothetical protein